MNKEEYPLNNPLVPDHYIMINPVVEIPLEILKTIWNKLNIMGN